MSSIIFLVLGMLDIVWIVTCRADGNVSQPVDGEVRLRGGRSELEGNVEVYHGGWGGVCDDEWDIADATVVCRQLGFKRGAISFTVESHFGRYSDDILLDNLACTGHEKRLMDCRHDGWRRHDCSSAEVAGVVCKPNPTTRQENPVKKPEKLKISEIFPDTPLKLALSNGRTATEGRVEIVAPKAGVICAENWSLKEAMVVCRQLNMSYAQQAVKGQFQGSPKNAALHNIRCTGEEATLDSCTAEEGSDTCGGDWIVGVVCSDYLPDLVVDLELLRDTVYLHDQTLHFLQCAMEENCLASGANSYINQPGWYNRIRRLLRFSTKVHNAGDADFLPHAAKEQWQWHQCHMHYHSMEVFAHYDIIDPRTGRRVAEGHKASFCLEDVDCDDGSQKRYACVNYGNQGISPGCWDTYFHNIDCQWIDVTDLHAGIYTFKIAVNPEYRVAEKNFTNNAVSCDMYYDRTEVLLTNCEYTLP